MHAERFVKLRAGFVTVVGSMITVGVVHDVRSVTIIIVAGNVRRFVVVFADRDGRVVIRVDEWAGRDAFVAIGLGVVNQPRRFVFDRRIERRQVV